MNTVLVRPSNIVSYNFVDCFKQQLFLMALKELNQRMILLMNMMMKNEGSSRQASNKDLKQTTDEDGDELLELLKKTQTEVNALENEFKKVEAENLHQDQGSQTR